MSFSTYIAFPKNGVQMHAKLICIEMVNGEECGRYVDDANEIVYLNKQGRLRFVSEVGKSLDQKLGGNLGVHTGEARQG